MEKYITLSDTSKKWGIFERRIRTLCAEGRSVYGIDEVFYSTENNILMFGESKVSMGIDNGIVNSSCLVVR